MSARGSTVRLLIICRKTTRNLEVVDLFEEDRKQASKPVIDKKYNIAVAGTGYVGLSIKHGWLL